jgi:hypothetical protein
MTYNASRGEKIAHSGKYNGTTYADEPSWEPPGDEPQDDGGNGESSNSEPGLARHLINRTGLRNLPDPEPLIADVLDQGTTALLYGRWGSGKSFIGIDWAACVATGKPWQGRPTEQFPVLYVAAEGAFGLKGRIDTWEAGWQKNIVDGQLDIFPKPINLTHAGHITELCALVNWGGYGLVVIDTLARCMVGADENSAQDCGRVVDSLNRVREHTPNARGVVLGIHHTGKDGKTFRGSSVFEAGADTVYSVTMDGAAIILDREKRKDGPRQDNHQLRLDTIPGHESCVISSHGGVKNSSDRAASLLLIFSQHFSVEGASRSELITVAKENGINTSTAYRALSDLLRDGFLVNEGTDSRPRYRLTGKVM